VFFWYIVVGDGWGRHGQFNFGNFSIFVTSANTMYKLSEDSAQVPIHVGAFLIKFYIIEMSVHLLVKITDINQV
jgi:hypothetical protein